MLLHVKQVHNPSICSLESSVIKTMYFAYSVNISVQSLHKVSEGVHAMGKSQSQVSQWV
jgi:hypothetical protein